MKRLLFFITFIILAVAIDSTAQQADRRNRAITGRVINDSGQPFANATIQLNRVGARQGPGSTAGSDEQGNFRVDDLDNGAYVVSAFVPGFVSASEIAEPQYHRPGDSVTLQMTKGGVITGAVTTATGEPVVAARIRAIRVRELDGRAARANSGTQERPTDDRGVYRLYGLRSGVYLVMVVGRSMYSFGGPPSLYEGNAPTYYPSSTRDTAGEVMVRTGDEATGIDIRYRGERGHVISGTVTGAVEGSPQQGGITVTLAHASSGITEAQEFVQFRDNNRAFALYGVPDGEYELSARRGSQSDSAASLPRRVVVKGSDITGLEVVLAPIGSIAGNVIIETMKESERKPECSDKRPSTVEEIVITARRDDKGSKDRPRAMSRSDGSPNDKGEFTLFNLRAGLFRIQPLLPGESWYVRSISMIRTATGKSKVVAGDAALSGIKLNQGERLSGLTISVAEGAASITGKLLPATEGRQLPAQIRVHLAPAEPELVDDALRYREAMAENDGSFRLANLPPGRYLIFAKEATEAELSEDGPRPAAWDAATRVAVKREASAINQTIELQPCRRITDYSLRIAAATQKPEPIKTEPHKQEPSKPAAKKP